MKLWRLLESDCHKLDLELAMVGKGREDDRRGFAVYSEKIREIQKLEEEKESVAQYATTLDGLTTAVAMRVGQTSEMVQKLRQEAIKARDLLTHIVSTHSSSYTLTYMLTHQRKRKYLTRKTSAERVLTLMMVHSAEHLMRLLESSKFTVRHIMGAHLQETMPTNV